MVLRSHYTLIRALLAVAMVAVVGLTIALVIVASEDEQFIGTGASTPAVADTNGPAVRYDGGPEEGTRGALGASAQANSLPPATRYDGGPEEGTRGVTSTAPAPVTERQAFPGLAAAARASAPADGTRYDGGPDEGTRGPVSVAPPATRYDGGPEEGTRGP